MEFSKGYVTCEIAEFECRRKKGMHLFSIKPDIKKVCKNKK